MLDADGLRRLKLGGADIGAYEYGDVTFEHTASAANVFGNVTVLDDPATNGATGALLFPTRKSVYGLGVSDRDFGLWYSAPSWTIYYEDFSQTIEAGAAWNVFVPAAGDGAFVHTGSAANTSGSGTTIDNAMTNGLPDRIVLVRHDWTRDGTYLDHPLGVFYSGSRQRRALEHRHARSDGDAGRHGLRRLRAAAGPERVPHRCADRLGAACRSTIR